MSAPDSEQLAEQFRQTDPKRVRTDCPPADRIWEAVAGELSPEAVRQIVEHTAQCMDCSIAWRVALEVGRETESDGRVASLRPLRSRAARSFLFPGVGLAAAAIAVLLLRGPWTHPDRRGPVEAERGSKRSLVSLNAPGTQPRNAVVLRWSPLPGAERYSVTVLSSSLDVLHRAFGLSTTEFRIPPESLSGQPSPARVLWSVEATLPGGGVIDSDVFTVDIE